MVWIPSIIEFVLRLLFPSSYWYFGPAIIAFIVYYFYVKTFVHWKIFKVVILSFKSLVLLTSLIITIISDTFISFYIFGGSFNHFIHTFCDDIFYIVPGVYLLMFDCIETMSRPTRFLLPLIFCIAAAQNIYLSYTVWPDQWSVNVINYKNGQLTLLDIMRSAYLQVILFYGNLIFKLCTDYNHKQFEYIKHRIVRNEDLRKKQQCFAVTKNICCKKVNYHIAISINDDNDNNDDRKDTIKFSVGSVNETFLRPFYNDAPFKCKTRLLFIFIFLLGFTEIVIFSLGIYHMFLFQIVVIFISLLLFIYLLSSFVNFNVTMQIILRQFRVWILLISMGILFGLFIYGWICNIMHENHEYYISSFCYTLIYCLGVLLCIIRDGMVFPFWASILLPLSLLIASIISGWNDFFVWKLPTWYSYVERTCYIQVSLLMILILYNVLYRDPNHMYYTLILRKMKRNFREFDDHRFTTNS